MARTHNFKEVFALLKVMPGIESTSKEELISEFTKGRTTHLHELSWTEYHSFVDMLREAAGQKPKRQRNDAEVWRKRCIASVFGWFALIKEYHNMDYVKGVICRAAATSDAKRFNELTVNQLRAVYNEFVRMQRTKENTKVVVTDEMRKAGYYD